MSTMIEIAKHTLEYMNAGHVGLFTSADFSLMLHIPLGVRLNKTLHKAEKKGVIKRVCKGIYINPSMAPKSKGVLAQIAKLIRWDNFNYISLESQLSHLGVISQVMFNHLTIMTSGRSGIIKTLYGDIEFTHTKKSISKMADDIYFDQEVGMFRATELRAKADLVRVGRNLDMLESIDVR